MNYINVPFKDICHLQGFNRFKTSDDGYRLVGYHMSHDTRFKPWFVEKNGKRFRAPYMFVWRRFMRPERIQNLKERSERRKLGLSNA